MITILKIVWSVAFPIIMLALFSWAREYTGKKVETVYFIKSIFWALVLDIPFITWFFEF